MRKPAAFSAPLPPCASPGYCRAAGAASAGLRSRGVDLRRPSTALRPRGVSAVFCRSRPIVSSGKMKHISRAGRTVLCGARPRFSSSFFCLRRWSCSVPYRPTTLRSSREAQPAKRVRSFPHVLRAQECLRASLFPRSARSRPIKTLRFGPSVWPERLSEGRGIGSSPERGDVPRGGLISWTVTMRSGRPERRLCNYDGFRAARVLPADASSVCMEQFRTTKTPR